MLRQGVFVSQQRFFKARSFYVATKHFCVAIKFGLGWSFYVATEYSHVVTGLAKVKRIYVAMEYFFVATVFGFGQ